ncbi:class A sortase [Gemella haemolysans]|uniref:Sortase family protein n=1 Tax=Gemella haemolysans ATCC 10379 TaxID=546270 RepID=C5NY06_9BACL|nr:class A sortase [Gemella haemolysans]EER67862.1 sortase family protein [Gemella haemolysans ATCC 10379]KAA8708925.1 class A sortase [Gemella haemolysans]UBH82865.1 class A sortase [Gemella haemolysans]VEI38870.1 Sortase (surface protein transpeptidase) [Gemella haemolysans]
MNKKFKNAFLNVLIVVLLCTSVVLIFKNQIREYLTGNANDKIITAYKNNKGEVDIPWWQKMFTDNESKIKLTDSMLGILKIDSVDIEEPIFQDVTEINLINGVATSQEPSTLDAQNVVIAGHSVQGVGIRFNNLNKIKNGAKIQIISKDKLRTYEVNKLYDVVPTQVEILEQHENEPKILKLFTCDNFNPQTGEWESRFVVEAKLIGEESA